MLGVCPEELNGNVNVPADTPATYYKTGVFYPFVDNVLSQIRERFSAHTVTALALQSLLSKYCVDRSFETIESAVELYLLSSMRQRCNGS